MTRQGQAPTCLHHDVQGEWLTFAARRLFASPETVTLTPATGGRGDCRVGHDPLGALPTRSDDATRLLGDCLAGPEACFVFRHPKKLLLRGQLVQVEQKMRAVERQDASKGENTTLVSLDNIVFCRFVASLVAACVKFTCMLQMYYGLIWHSH